MIAKPTVTVQLNKEDNEMLNNLVDRLTNETRVNKAPSKAEVLRYVLRFTSQNMDLPKLYEELRVEAEVDKKKNELLEQVYSEYKKKTDSIISE
ncbi:hypothetical protein D1B33_09720 [Lysinibacillus yapensis]|uniref:DNA-binding protein n=1 Tax=Ureibacillus yapensis TaxID=2304605 RepID=A0A396S7L6_9BACL|nr:hypothetical protein [Lysinibacillus yapensis]RHW36670.1 hypothetical protein D1B33_09720 [Lysinibacillus yapensis]